MSRRIQRYSPMTKKTGSYDKVLRWAWLVLAVSVFGLVLAIRIRLLGIPLERDEGEYAYAGQLMLQGIPPYELAYNMKFPGTYAAYAAIMSVFGQTIDWDSFRTASGQCGHNRADLFPGATAGRSYCSNRGGSELCGPFFEPVRNGSCRSRDALCHASGSGRVAALTQSIGSACVRRLFA